MGKKIHKNLVQYLVDKLCTPMSTSSCRTANKLCAGIFIVVFSQLNQKKNDNWESALTPNHNVSNFGCIMQAQIFEFR